MRAWTLAYARSLSLWNVVMGTVLTLVIGGYAMAKSGSSSTTTTTSTISMVERRDIVSSVKAVGKVTFASEQQMRFNQKGTMTKVNYKEGDSVKRGQVIAELDMTTVLADIRTAQLAIGASSLQLKQLQSDKQKSVLDAQNAFNVSQQKLPADLDTAKRTVAEKQNALDQAKLDLEKQKSTELQSLAITAQTSMTSAENLLDSTYSVLTLGTDTRPSDPQQHDLIINNLLYRDPTMKTQVEFAYTNALNADTAMRSKYGVDLTTEQDPNIILQALQDAGTLAKAVSTLEETTYALLQGATTDTHSFTTSSLQTYRSTINTNRTTAANLISTIQSAQANLAALSSDSDGVPSITLKQKEDAVTVAQNALTEAQNNLQVVQTQTPGDLKSQQQALSNTMTSTDINIQLKQNQIGQQSAALQKTRKTLDDYRLVAPFDGVIRHIDYKVGDNLLDTGDTEYLTIQNPDFIVVTIPLDQVDVVTIKSGMPARIVFDAVPGREFDGAIDQIDPTPIQQSGVVSYNVSVRMPAPKDLTLLSGMTAAVTIETSRKTAVLAVPSLSLSYQNNRATVAKPSGETASVQTGASDGTWTEITSGLQEGDAVVSVNLSTAKAARTTSSANTQQLFRGLGGGGAPPH
jgi:HlyD family secretion protein